jgi:hypothetical protein
MEQWFKLPMVKIFCAEFILKQKLFLKLVLYNQIFSKNSAFFTFFKKKSVKKRLTDLNQIVAKVPRNQLP